MIRISNLKDNENYTLFTTPETLSVRLAQIAEKHNGSLKDICVYIYKNKAHLRKWGEKNIYRAKEIESEEEAIKMAKELGKQELREKPDNVHCAKCGEILSNNDYCIEEEGIKKYYCETCAKSENIFGKM